MGAGLPAFEHPKDSSDDICFAPYSYLEALVDARERGLVHDLPQAEEEDCARRVGGWWGVCVAVKKEVTTQYGHRRFINPLQKQNLYL